MPALMISEITVKSPEKMAEYMTKTQALARQFGVELIANAEFARPLTHDDAHHRVVIAKFPDLETLERWYTSDAYAGACAPARGRFGSTHDRLRAAGVRKGAAGRMIARQHPSRR